MKLKLKNSLGEGIKNFQIKAEKVQKKSLKKAGLQLINWIVNGSPTNPRVPPIKFGTLRGSGSVFVENKLVGTTQTAKGTPNLSYSGKEFETIIGFNTPYAKRMHETKWNPGPVSRQSGDVGNKFVESHLKSDGKKWLEFVGKLMEKEL